MPKELKKVKVILWGAIFGIVTGVLFEAEPVGESQADIDWMKADLLSLPGNNLASLSNLKKDNKRAIVYRALNSTDVETIKAGTGIIAKNPIVDWGIEEHILYGSNEDA